MNEDRELLELAAFAAGYDTSHPMNAQRLELDPPVIALLVQRKDGSGFRTAWNPLNSSDAEAEMEADLSLDVVWMPESVCVGGCREKFKDYAGDRQAARRRAGVCAAASIGNQMKEQDK